MQTPFPLRIILIATLSIAGLFTSYSRAAAQTVDVRDGTPTPTPVRRAGELLQKSSHIGTKKASTLKLRWIVTKWDHKDHKLVFHFYHEEPPNAGKEVFKADDEHFEKIPAQRIDKDNLTFPITITTLPSGNNQGIDPGVYMIVGSYKENDGSFLSKGAGVTLFQVEPVQP